MKYEVTFQIGNQKLKGVVNAENEKDAEYRLLGKVKFLKVEKKRFLNTDAEKLLNIFEAIK